MWIDVNVDVDEDMHVDVNVYVLWVDRYGCGNGCVYVHGNVGG